MITNNHSMISPTKNGEIREVKEGLFTTEVKTPSGATLYLGYELMATKEQVDFWSDFRRQSMPKGAGYRVVGCIRDALFNNEALPDYPHDFSAAFESESDYKEVQKKFADKKLFTLNFKMIAADAVKFLKPELSSEQTSNYIVYASKEPITDYRCNRPMRHSEIDEEKHKELLANNDKLSPGYRVDDPSEYLDYIKNYGDILMCVGAHTAKNSPSVTHMGIFRNFADYLSPSDEYNNISLILHGFGARVATEILEKQFLVFQPLNKMAEIIKNKVGEEKIIKASQKDVKGRLQEHYVEKGLEYPNDIEGLNQLLHYDDTLTGTVMLVDLDELTGFSNPPVKDKSLDKPTTPSLLKALKDKDWSQAKNILKLDENADLLKVARASVSFAMEQNLLGVIPLVLTKETGFINADLLIENLMRYAAENGKLDHLKEFLASSAPVITNEEAIEDIFKAAVLQDQTDIVKYFLKENPNKTLRAESVCTYFCYAMREGKQEQVNLFCDWVNNNVRFNQLCNKASNLIKKYDFSLGFDLLATINEIFKKASQNNKTANFFQNATFDIKALEKVRESLIEKISTVLWADSFSIEEKKQATMLYENCFTEGNTHYGIFGEERDQFIDKVTASFRV